MRKRVVVVFMLLVVCLSGTVWGQTTITIGTGTSTNYYPIPGFYGWQYDVYLYTPSVADALNNNISISSIAYNISSNNTSSGSQITIWVKDVNADYTLNSSTTFNTFIDGATQVYNNTSYTPSGTGWNTYNFSSTFQHSCGKALLVAVRGKGCGTSGGCSRYCYYTSATGTHWYKHQDSSDPGYNTTGTSIDGERANIRLTYTSNSSDYCCSSPNKDCIVGDVTSTDQQSSLGPVNNLYNYSYRQIIYTSEELGIGLGGGGTSGTIYAIGFQYATGTSFTRNNVNIYMANTTESSFETTNSWLPAANFTPVYSGSVSFTHAGWCWIELATPFNYSGDNLVLAIDDNHGSWNTAYNFYCTDGPANSQLYVTSDGTNYAHPPTQTGTQTAKRPNTIFCIHPTCTQASTPFEFAEQNASVQAGQTYTQTITGTNITYSIAPAGLATINPSTGVVTTTAGQYGIVTITARQEATGGYCKRIASYTLTITDCDNAIILNKNLTRNIECGTEYCFYDSGIDGKYQNNENYTATFTSSGLIHIRFESALQGESSYDYMSIDGITTTVSNVASIAAGTEYVSSAVGGSVTVRWRSDGSGQYNGWKAIITATDCCPSSSYNCSGSSSTEYTLDGGGSISNNYYDGPISPYYNYSYHQILYTSDELGGSSGEIKAIGFQYASTSAMTNKTNVTVYMSNVASTVTAFTNTTWQTPTFTQVFSGCFNFTEQGWAWIALDAPFNYTGGSLIITFDDNSGSWESKNFYYHTKTNSHLRYYNDGTNPTHPNPSQTATLTSNRPNTKFCIERSCTNRDGHVRIASGCVATLASGQTTTLVGSVDAGYGGGTAHWTSSDGNIAIVDNNGVVTGKTPGTVTVTYTRDEDGTYCTASATCEILVECATNNQTFAFNTTTGSVAEDATLNIAGYLTVPTGATVTSYTSANTSIATVTNAGVVTGVSTGTTTITATIAQWTYDGVTYCQRTTTNSFTVTVTGGFTCESANTQEIGTAGGTSYQYGPVNTNYYYSIYQIIYDPSELCAGPISGVAFHYAYSSASPTRSDVGIFLGTRTSSTFASESDWTPVSEMTEVYRGPFNFYTANWKWFAFNTPYVYSGDGSLVMMIVDYSHASWNSSCTFYYSSCDGYKMIRAQRDGTTPYDETNLSEPSWGLNNVRPDTRFCINCCTERTGTAGFDFCRDALTIDVGSSAAITMPVEGADGVSPSGAVSYSSSNTSVATVSSDGTVTGVANGSATITATMAYDDPTGYCPVSAKYNVQVGPPAPCFEIGTGTSYNYYPIPGFYGWQYDVYIYTPTAAPELNNNLSITSIAYYITSANATSTSQMTVWVKDVDPATALATGTTFATYINGASQVYNNTSYSAPNTGWQTLDFSSSFTHTGGQALLVAVRGVGCSTSGGCSRYCSYTSATGTHWYRHKDSSDPGTTTTTDVYKDDQRANIKLCYEASTFTPDVMPTVDVTNASQPNICYGNAITNMNVTASDDVTFSPALNTLGLNYNSSTNVISGTPNFTGSRTVTVTVTSDDGCLKSTKDMTITVNQLDATIETTNP